MKPDQKRYFVHLKIGVFFALYPLLGTLLIYDGITSRKGPVTFDDIYPGFAVLIAGFVFLGYFYFIRHSSNDKD